MRRGGQSSRLHRIRDGGMLELDCSRLDHRCTAFSFILRNVLRTHLCYSGPGCDPSA